MSQPQSPTNQEVQGVFSPFLRNQRLRKAAAHISRGSIVLDIACGLGSLAEHLDSSCTYYGVDRIPFSDALKPKASCKTHFLECDVSKETALEEITGWMESKPTVITMLAFLEHLPSPAEVVGRFMGLLNEGGHLLGTTPHPMGRTLHDVLAKVRLCSPDGADEHEEFLNRNRLAAVARESGAEMVDYGRFLLGLNQYFKFSRI